MPTDEHALFGTEVFLPAWDSTRLTLAMEDWAGDAILSPDGEWVEALQMW